MPDVPGLRDRVGPSVLPGARRREGAEEGGHAKTHPPVGLLLPVITPLGDLSAVRVLVRQFDGLVVVLTGVLVMNELPSAPAEQASGPTGAGVPRGSAAAGQDGHHAEPTGP
ncbi:hypothetical protein ACH4M4_06450 [Streptomyces sp. NPDC017254]|uniref:hypothetical protein n=1 Tax=unclassified Streptomyces TaxID=2593676 RepID=UPI003789D1AD